MFIWQYRSSFNRGKGIWGLRHNIRKFLISDAPRPVFNVNLSRSLLIIKVVKYVLKRFFLNNDSYLFNTAEETSKVKLSSVINIKELQLFYQKCFLTREGIRFELNFKLELIFKAKQRLGIMGDMKLPLQKFSHYLKL